MASSLKHLRSTYAKNQVEHFKALSQKRLSSIRESLGTASIKMPGIEELQNLKSNQVRSMGSSDFVKRFYRKALLSLKEQSLYGSPQIVDPSTMWHEVQEQEDEYYGSIMTRFIEEFQSNLDTDLESLFFTYHIKVVEADEDVEVRCKNLNSKSTNKVDTQLKNLAQVIENHLPKAIGSLGYIRRIDITDGRVVKLKINDCQNAPLGSEANLSDQDETTITIGLLINMITKNDAFFIESQRQLLRILEGEIQKLKDKDDENSTEVFSLIKFGGLDQDEQTKLNILIETKEHLLARHEGAKAIHKRLDALSEVEVKKLLDALLQLQFEDIPTSEDIVAMRKYHMALIKHAQESPKFAKTYEKNIKAYEADFMYYKSLHEDLYLLENFLSEKKSQNKVLQEVINNIKGVN